jgi:hypothetical protein
MPAQFCFTNGQSAARRCRSLVRRIEDRARLDPTGKEKGRPCSTALLTLPSVLG